MLENSVKLHITVWIVLAVAAAATAGPYTFASCWPIFFVYFPPAGLFLVAIFSLSLLVFLVIQLAIRLRKPFNENVFLASQHGLILVAGLTACGYAAMLSAGQVSCL